MLPPKFGTLEQFVKDWQSSVAVNLKGGTGRAAESHLRAHIIPKLGSQPLTEINTKTIQGFVAYLASSGRSKKTFENVLMTLSSILRTAKAWEYARGNFPLAGITMPGDGVRKEQRISLTKKWGKSLRQRRNAQNKNCRHRQNGAKGCSVPKPSVPEKLWSMYKHVPSVGVAFVD